MFRAVFYPRQVKFYKDNVHASVTNSMSDFPVNMNERLIIFHVNKVQKKVYLLTFIISRDVCSGSVAIKEMAKTTLASLRRQENILAIESERCEH